MYWHGPVCVASSSFHIQSGWIFSWHGVSQEVASEGSKASRRPSLKDWFHRPNAVRKESWHVNKVKIKSTALHWAACFSPFRTTIPNHHGPNRELHLKGEQLRKRTWMMFDYYECRGLVPLLKWHENYHREGQTISSLVSACSQILKVDNLLRMDEGTPAICESDGEANEERVSVGMRKHCSAAPSSWSFYLHFRCLA